MSRPLPCSPSRMEGQDASNVSACTCLPPSRKIACSTQDHRLMAALSVWLSQRAAAALHAVPQRSHIRHQKHGTNI